MAIGELVGYLTWVVGCRARRWVIACVALAASCATTTAPPPVVARAIEPACPADERDPGQKPEHVLALVGLTDGMTVVDLGSGDGYFLCRLSRAVGTRGRVIATEIGQRRVKRLEARVAREGLRNVEVLTAPTDDVGIAAGSADRILLVNVWHHLRRRQRYAGRIARALAPGGTVIVVDFPRGRGRGTHGIAPERVLAELAAGGFTAAVVTDELAGQFVIVGRVAAK